MNPSKRRYNRRMSRRLIFALVALCLTLPFQNCSENLPARETSKSSSSTAPNPQPQPQPTPQPSPTVVPNNATVTMNSVTLNSSAILAGGSVAITTRLTADQAVTSGTLKLSVYNSAQALIWTQDFPSQSLPAGTPKNLLQNFNASETLAPDTYTVGAEFNTGSKKFAFPNVANFEVRAPIRVSAGSTAPYTDSMGRVWSADTGFSGTSVPTTEVLASVQGSNDPLLYSSFRYGWDSVNFVTMPFTFTANVPSAGKYKVTLKWVEHYVFGPNLRLFNVTINGNTVLQNFDLYTSAGGAFIAYDRSFVILANQATPQVQVTFQPGPIENPKINAIEILGSP